MSLALAVEISRNYTALAVSAFEVYVGIRRNDMTRRIVERNACRVGEVPDKVHSREVQLTAVLCAADCFQLI